MRREDLFLESQEAKYKIIFHPGQPGVSSFFLKGITAVLGMPRKAPAHTLACSLAMLVLLHFSLRTDPVTEWWPKGRLTWNDPTTSSKTSFTSALKLSGKKANMM